MDWRGGGRETAGGRGREGRDRDPEGGSEGRRLLSGARELRSPWKPLHSLSAARPDPRPSRYFLEVWGNAPNFFIKYFTGHCAGCGEHSQTEPHVTPTLQEAPRKGGGLQQQDGRKEKGWGSRGSDPESEKAGRKEPGSPFPSAAPLTLTSPEPIAGPSGQEVGGGPSSCDAAAEGGRSGGRCTPALGLGALGLGAPAIEARCSAPPARSQGDSAPVDPLLCPPCPTPAPAAHTSRVLRVCSHQTLTPCATRPVSGRAGGQGAIITPWAL